MLGAARTGTPCVDRAKSAAVGDMTQATPTPRRRVRRFVFWWLVILGVVYLGGVAVFSALERFLVFRPSSPTEAWLKPEDPRTQDVSFVSADGTALHGW